jgi:EAL domain-containing protein (putative c-di-GMP-specific phosphodiesterase class I)
MSDPTASSGPQRRRDTLTLDSGDAGDIRSRVLEARARATAATTWILESRDGDGSVLQRMAIRPLPFRVGRAPGHELVLASAHVSKSHAEIYSDGDALRVRDLGSRNGTFLNRQRISDASIHCGDVLHFGDREFRLADKGESSPSDELTRTRSHRGPSPARHVVELLHLLRTEAVTLAFQPIVEMPSRRVAAYEALGRGRHPGLPESPMELFEIAAEAGTDAQVDLSRLFRRRAVEMVVPLPEPPVVFLNTHPVELERPGLIESLEELRALAPQVDLVLEIHERALAQTDFIVWLRTRLMEINVGLAFDDFGAGQARLFELAEAPPHFLKFDRRFITGIDHAPSSRQRLLASLVAAARELRVKTIAEGVETPEEEAECVRAGFSHAQGYHLGRPASLEQVLGGGEIRADAAATSHDS